MLLSSALGFAQQGPQFVAGGGQVQQQAPTSGQPQKGTDAQSQPLESWMPDFLQNLPHPPTAPSSLFTAPAPGGDYGCPQLSDQPYLVKEPLLDLPGFPQAGWYAGAQAELVGAHIVDRLAGTVQVGTRINPDLVQLEPRGLDPTVAPQAEIGYRLPSNFGGFSVGFRTLSTDGTFTAIGPDGLAATQTRLTFTTGHFDYESWVFTPSDNWTMRWRFGAQLVYLYYDVNLNQSPGIAAPGSGVLQQRATDMFDGIGPHASVELTHRLGDSGWSLLGMFDFASVFGRIKQDVSETALEPSRPRVDWGELPRSSSQTLPIITGLLGVNWHPSQWPNVDFSAGYQIEQWWNVGRFSYDQGFQRSRGDMTLNGLMLRFQYNY